MKKEGKGLTKEKIITAILFGFSFFYTFYALRLKLGMIENPGPGFIPIVIGILLLFCTALYSIRVFGRKSPGTEKVEDLEEEEVNYRVIFGILACAVVYPFLLPVIKFVLSTLVVTFCMLIILNPRRPFFSLFFAAVFSISTFLVFSRLLGVVLPRGFIEGFFYRIGG